MWIFGYGSLMFDGWEAACGCTDRKWADLPGYRRCFNKKSVESRGTREAPGLTLNLVRAAVRRFGQRVGNPRTNPDHRCLFDAQLHRNGVGGLEADAADVAREPVRVLGHDLDGVGTVGLENPYRPRCADTVAVQKDHDLPHRLLFSPGGENAGGANRT